MTKEELLGIITLAEEEKRALTEEEKTIINQALDECRATQEEERVAEEEKKDETDTPTVDEDTKEESEESEKEDKETEESEVKETENKRSINTTKKHMNSKFSLVKAIRSVAENKQMDEVNAAVIAAGFEESRATGLASNGQIQIPLENRDVISVTAEGEDLVPTDIYDILTPLRAKNVLIAAGAKVYSGLVGNVQIPIMTKENVGWAAELAEAADGAGTFSSVTLSPKRLTAYIDISKQMIAQDAIGVENAIRADLVAAINSKLEETLLGAADKTATQPEGLFHAVTATSIASFADVCDKEAEIDDANVLGSPVYVMSNKAKAAFRAMAKGTKSTQLVYENGAVDGTQAYNTSNIEGKKYLYGDFSNVVIGQWGSLDITVDPYTKATAGQIRLVVNMYVDAVVTRPEGLAAGELA